MPTSSRKGKTDAEGQSEIISAASAPTAPGARLSPQGVGLLLWSQWARMALLSASGVGPKQGAAWAVPPQRAKGAGNSTEPQGWCCHPSGPGGQSIRTKRVILNPWLQMGLASLGFGLVWDPSLPSFQLPPCGVHLSSLYPSHHQILEARNLSDFTGFGCREILSQDKSQLEPHARLI